MLEAGPFGRDPDRLRNDERRSRHPAATAVVRHRLGRQARGYRGEDHEATGDNRDRVSNVVD